MTYDDPDLEPDHEPEPDTEPGPSAASPSEQESGSTTTLGFTLGDRVAIFVIFPLLGALLGLVLPTLSGWLVGLDLPVMRGPLRLVRDWGGSWPLAALVAGGVLLGLGVAFVSVFTALKVTVTHDWLRVERDDAGRTIPREEVDAVFVDGKQLVILDRESRQLVRDVLEAKPARVAEAFTAHGYPWTKRDPYQELYRRWVADTPELPGAVNALLQARQAALRKKAKGDVTELRDEVQKLGYVIRDDAAKQYWRPLVRP